ncbi:unnamed protein product, partial [Brachionus calyciflorus]
MSSATGNLELDNLRSTIRNLFKCDYCDKLLETPWLINCPNKNNKSIKLCANDLNNLTFIKCKYCQSKHKIKLKEIESIINLNNLLNLLRANSKNKNLNLDEAVEECLTLIVDSNAKTELVNLMNINPQAYLDNFFTGCYEEIEQNAEKLKNSVSKDLDDFLAVKKNDRNENLKKLKNYRFEEWPLKREVEPTLIEFICEFNRLKTKLLKFDMNSDDLA